MAWVRSFGQQVDEELLKERRNAQRKARAAAWEEEKREAAANKVQPLTLGSLGPQSLNRCAPHGPQSLNRCAAHDRLRRASRSLLWWCVGEE